MAPFDDVGHGSNGTLRSSNLIRVRPVGANDNASGTAALLAVALRLAGRPLKRTVRGVFFVNEEPPFFQTEK